MQRPPAAARSVGSLSGPTVQPAVCWLLSAAAAAPTQRTNHYGTLASILQIMEAHYVMYLGTYD